MRGLNTEIDPRQLGRLKQGGFAQYMNLTMRSETMVPIAGDGTHTSPTFAETNLGTLIVSEPFSISGTAGFQAYVALAGGTVTLRDGTGATSPIAVAAPGTIGFSSFGFNVTLGSNGIPWGSTRTYAGAWAGAGGYISGLSPILEVTNNAYRQQASAGSGAVPVYGETFSVGTGTATYLGGVGASWSGGETIFYSPPGTFASGATATFASGGAAVLYGSEATAAFVLPSLQVGTGTAPPTGMTAAALYGLANSGIYYRTGTGASGTNALSDTTYFESLLDADRQALVPYEGPLDANGLPETLVVPGTCQTLAIHKGCLFVAESNLLKWSEGAITGVEYRWFREGFGIDCGGTIWSLVSRGELLEVFTDKGIKYIVGNAPYFEIRDSQIHEVAVSRYSIVGTDIGTFYHAADGLRLLTAAATKLLSQGWNTPWFEDIAAPGSTKAGASKGKYYLVDATGRCLMYDWEGEEWQERTFATQPSGFLWSATDLHLVAKVSSSYVAVEDAPLTAVSWIVQRPTRSGAKNSPIPSFFWLDNVGPCTVKVYVDDVLTGTIPVAYTTKGRIRLPRARGVAWYMTIEGTGTAETSAIRSLQME